ncbi:hypothetical protein [Photobacterium kishitanii]|uniref:hypothetical protein n=1 Tax=Photobacterium kishitanii TaxID=318456 RepID=UPI0015E70440|nr:hypothetical protein [Photobacterium kishitanii]
MAIKFECIDRTVKLFHADMLVRETSRHSEKFQEHGGKFIEMLTGTKIEDIPSNIDFYIDGLPDDFSPVIAVSLDHSKNGMSLLLQLDFVDLDAWNEPYSYGSYVDYLDELIEGQSIPIKKYSKHESVSSPYLAALGVTFHLDEGDVVESILSYAKKISLAQKQVHVTLVNKEPKDALVKLFSFPKEYEAICVQYLVWFGEFLAELGIKAQVISEQNGTSTKFIVAPEDAEETLAQVEKLFYTYLSLPYAEFLPASNSDVYNKVLLLNLKAQVDYFKTQIELKEATIEMKSTTIRTLQTRYEQASKELLLLKSVRDDRLELFGGVFSLGSFAWGPFTLNTKAVLEKLRHNKESKSDL